MKIPCLIGACSHAGLHSDTVVRVADGGHPDQMLPTLRAIWRQTFDGDTTAFTDRLLRHHWATLDPQALTATKPGDVVEPGLGTARTPADYLNAAISSIARPPETGTTWRYTVDALDEDIVVYRATAHGTWSMHGRHRLHADLDGAFSSPRPTLGDAATADEVGHHWMAATVSVDGLHTAWDAEVCTGEHARGVIVARFDHDTLTEAIEVLDTFYADRLPGSGLPRHDLDGDVLVTTWYAGTPHAQSQVTYADAHGRFILGPHVWPWILTGEHQPTRNGALRNGTAPILEWTSPDGFFACHPSLRGYPLAQVSAAISGLAGTRGVAVLEAASGGGHVWLVAPSHALMITPMVRDDSASTVLLPRPLGGSWTTDEPVPTLTTDQVTAECARRAPGHRPT